MDPGPSMNPNLSPITSPRNSIAEPTVADWDGQNTSNHFEMGGSQPRVDERFITMRRKRSSVSEHPRFPKSKRVVTRQIIRSIKEVWSLYG